MGSPADTHESKLGSEARSKQADMLTSADKWPVGLERQRPRLPQNYSVVIGTPPGGVAGIAVSAAGTLSGLIGASGIPGTRALSLDQSLRFALPRLSVTFVSLRQYGHYEARLVFETLNDGYKVAKANADPRRTWAADELDDWLYVNLLVDVLKKLEAHS